jgi:hypothetical protein
MAHRNHLDAAEVTDERWRDRWDAARMFVTADGESGKAAGNETIRVDEAGRLRIKVPAALVDQLDSHVVIAAPVRFTHRGGEWAQRIAARRAVRYDIHVDPDRGRWYLNASWKTAPEPPPGLDELRAGRVLASISTPTIWPPVSWTVRATRSASQPPSTWTLQAWRRRGVMGGCAAITALLDHAQQQNCSAVVVENLDFADARATGRKPWAAASGGSGFAAP